MIDAEPPRTSDPELAAKRAIDEAVATLRSLAQGVQQQARAPARPEPRPPRGRALADGGALPDGAALPDADALPDGEGSFAPDLGRPPVEERLREGFHRLGLVLGLACVAAGVGVFLAASDFAGGRVDIRRAAPLLLAAGVVYGLCRALAWVALGFAGVDAGARPPEAWHATLAGPRSGPRGFGGWLWLPVAAAVLAPFGFAEILLSRAAELQGLVTRPPEVRAALAAFAAVVAALAVAWLFALVLMLRRSRRFPALYTALSLTSLALIGLGWLAAGWAGTAGPAWAALLRPHEGSEWLKAAVEELTRAVWIPYLLRSRRVRNTFVA